MTGSTPAIGGPATSATVGARLDIPVEVAGRLAISVAVAGGLDAVESLTISGADRTGIPHHVLDSSIAGPGCTWWTPRWAT